MVTRSTKASLLILKMYISFKTKHSLAVTSIVSFLMKNYYFCGVTLIDPKLKICHVQGSHFNFTVYIFFPQEADLLCSLHWNMRTCQFVCILLANNALLIYLQLSLRKFSQSMKKKNNSLGKQICKYVVIQFLD